MLDRAQHRSVSRGVRVDAGTGAVCRHARGRARAPEWRVSAEDTGARGAVTPLDLADRAKRRVQTEVDIVGDKNTQNMSTRSEVRMAGGQPQQRLGRGPTGAGNNCLKSGC